jgi:DNA-binding NarL/FixJ family response regulator
MCPNRREVVNRSNDGPAIVRILVVDDFQPFLKTVRSLIQLRPEWLVVGEASDGLQALQKAEELQPDLVLLDIGLPKLSGFEVAQRIREISPESKILFLSQVSLTEVIREAMSLGAAGYVVKTHAGSELLAGMEAVLRGEQFISSGFPDRNSKDDIS